MRSLLPWRHILVAVAAVSLLTAATAMAGVPKFKPKTIVPGKAIGGVTVGMKKGKAIKAWGKPDRHTTEGTAVFYQYTAKSTLSDGTVVGPQQYAGFYVRNRRVIQIYIETAENTAVDPKLNKLKTSKGIKLHSTMSEAQSAYGFPTPTGGEAGASRGLYKQGGNCTLFYAPDSPYQDIQAIAVGRCANNAGLLYGM